MKKLQTLFRSRLTLRLWLTLVVPILGISLCILLAAGLFFDGYLMDQALADAQVQTEDAADSFSRSFRELRERMVRKISSADFRAKVLAAARADEEGYTLANNDLQQDLSEFAQMSGMARGALLVGTGRLGGVPQVFYSYEDSRRDQAWAMLDFDLSGVSGITLLPAAPLPGEDGDEVLTLVVPLYFNTTSLLLVRGDPAEADAVLYVFLDAAAVTEYLNLYCEDAYRGTLYLANEAGEPLSLTADAAGRAEDAADPIMTDKNGGPVWRQTIYWPFLLASRYGRGTAMLPLVASPKVETSRHGAVDALVAVAVHNEEAGELTLFAVNRDLGRDLTLRTVLRGFEGYALADWQALESDDLKAVNSAEAQPVRPVSRTGAGFEDGALCATLKAASFNVIRLKKV